MSSPPTGTVTFLFTDIEGSTRLAKQYPAVWPAAMARHHAILHHAIELHRGYVFQVIGDAFCAVFHTASDAVAAARPTPSARGRRLPQLPDARARSAHPVGRARRAGASLTIIG